MTRKIITSTSTPNQKTGMNFGNFFIDDQCQNERLSFKKTKYEL